jgi:putative membrane protein
MSFFETPFKQQVFVFLKGMAMGAADIIPGVSGGTVAFISGIYEKLLESISNFNLDLLKTLKNKGVLSAWRKVHGEFLAALLTGIAVSIFSLAKVIGYLLTHHEVMLWSFFFGLVLASIFFVAREVKEKFKPLHILGFVVGTAVAYYVTIIPPSSAPDATWFIFLSGLIAICAMILPGISGSFILLLLGSYQTIIHSIKTFDVVKILVFASGCVIGLLTFSKLLNWMFKNFRDITIMTLCGFLLGSLNKIWPWKTTLSTRIAHQGKPNEELVPFIQENVLPWNYSTVNTVEINELGIQAKEPYMALAFVAFLVGFSIIFLIEKAAGTKKRIHE